MIRVGVYYYVNHTTNDVAFMYLVKRLYLSIKPLKVAIILKCLCKNVLSVIGSSQVSEF